MAERLFTSSGSDSIVDEDYSYTGTSGNIIHMPCPVCGKLMLILIHAQCICPECMGILGDLVKEKSFIKHLQNYVKAYKLKNR